MNVYKNVCLGINIKCMDIFTYTSFSAYTYSCLYYWLTCHLSDHSAICALMNIV